MTKDLPVIGACLPAAHIAQHRDWIFEMDRDVEVQGFNLPAAMDGDWRPMAEAVNRLLDGHKGRIGTHGPFVGFPINAQDSLIRKVVEQRMMDALDMCTFMKGTHMVLHSPYSNWDHHNFTTYNNYREHLIEFTHLTLDKVVRRAENEGVVLVLENVTDVDPAERRRLVDSFDSPNFRLSVDTGHAHYAHFTLGAPPADQFILDAGVQLEHVHIQDADGYADRHWSPGEGTIAWNSVFGEIARLSQAPRVLLEIRDKDSVPAAHQYLVDRGLVR